MDTSKEYIKMCEKAGEIQVLWDKDILDFYTTTVYAELDYPDGGNLRGYKQEVWLPRQDQLQAMVKWHKTTTPSQLLSELHHWVAYETYPKEHNYAKSFTSMEQLWLAFVMLERYQKVWNGEDWVKE